MEGIRGYPKGIRLISGVYPERIRLYLGGYPDGNQRVSWYIDVIEWYLVGPNWCQDTQWYPKDITKI